MANDTNCPKCGVSQSDMVYLRRKIKAVKIQRADLKRQNAALRERVAELEGERNAAGDELEDLHNGIASALGWDCKGEPFVDIIRRHRETVEKLPETADGVRVTVGDEVFVVVGNERIDDGTQSGGIAGACVSWYVNPSGNFYYAMVDWKSGYKRPMSDCYSTPEAAQAANPASSRLRRDKEAKEKS